MYKISMISTYIEKEEMYQELLANLRDVDKREIEGLGVTVEEGVRRSIFDTQPVYYGRNLDNGKLGACWGIQMVRGWCCPNTYIIWALGTNELKHFRKSFVKESTKILDRWVEMYGDLTNTVATFNTESILWLKRLGAEFGNPYLINGQEYVDFHIRRKEKEDK